MAKYKSLNLGTVKKVMKFPAKTSQALSKMIEQGFLWLHNM